MNVVAALGAGLSGPLMVLAGFGGLNAAAVLLVLPILLLSTLMLRRPASRPGV